MTWSARRQGVFALIVVILAWGFTWPVNKVVLASLSPVWAVTVRSAIAAAALFLLQTASGRLALPPRGDLPVLFSITVLHMVGFNLLASWGLSLVPTGRTVVLAYTTPLWVAPGAALFLRESLTVRGAIGVIVGLAGLGTLFNPRVLDWGDRTIVLGNLAILVASLLWAASILHIRAHRWVSTPFALIPWETLLATLLLTPPALAFAPTPDLDWSPSFAALLLYLGVAGTAIAYWAVATASRHLPAVTTSLGLLATPVVSVTAATIWLGEPLTLSLVVAIALVLGGVAIGATGRAVPALDSLAARPHPPPMSDHGGVGGDRAPTKTELLQALRSSRDEVIALVRSLAPERLEEGRYEGGWNGRQILAHIASIEWSYPRLIDLARTPPSPEEHAAPTLAMKGGNDSYNDRQVAKREHLSILELLAEFEKNRAATIAAVEAAAEELFGRRIRSAGGVVGPLATVVEQIAVAHVLAHARDIAGDERRHG